MRISDWSSDVCSSDLTRHPFVVRAGQGQVRVTGTRFNVWMYHDQVRVTLVEGSVWVTSHQALAGNGSQLSPGMQASYKAGDYQPQIREVAPKDRKSTRLNSSH